MATSIEAAVESLRQIKSTEPPVWLVPKQELSQAVRAASKHLFSSLKLHNPKCPFDQLLIEGFDAEQVWQQIDLQSQPLLSNLRREVKKFEKNPEEISKLKEAVGGQKKKVLEEKETGDIDELDEDDDDDDINMDEDEEEEEEEDDDDGEEEEEKEKERGREEEGENEEEEKESEGEEKGGIEDKFLKIKELQEYLENDEAREFGLKKKKKTKTEEDTEEEESEDEEEEEEENDEDDEAGDEEDELGLFDEDDDDDDEDDLGNARF